MKNTVTFAGQIEGNPYQPGSGIIACGQLFCTAIIDETEDEETEKIFELVAENESAAKALLSVRNNEYVKVTGELRGHSHDFNDWCVIVVSVIEPLKIKP